jgi:hypothetical protein
VNFRERRRLLTMRVPPSAISPARWWYWERVIFPEETATGTSHAKA